jgi:hypothetical protein
MIASLRQKLSSLWLPPDRRPPRSTRRARLGFYGFRYRSARSRTSMVARCAIAAILLIATLAAASEQLSR